jgi:hypothetical protein
MDYQLGIEVNDVIRGLQLLTAQMKRDVNNDLKGPADFLAAAIKGRTPRSSKSHSRYIRRGKKGTRARKGSGVIVATYRPGNLQKSFRSLSKLRRIRLGAIVGPLLGGKRIDGYYAHFVNNDVKQTNGKVRSGLRFVEAGIAVAGPIAQRAIAEIISSKIETVDRQSRNTTSTSRGTTPWYKLYARARGRE